VGHGKGHILQNVQPRRRYCHRQVGRRLLVLDGGGEPAGNIRWIYGNLHLVLSRTRHYFTTSRREDGQLTNWWITAPGAYTYNTRAWTCVCVSRLVQFVRSFYMSPETQPFFSIVVVVVVVKSSPSVQTYSRHFRPPPIRPRDYKDRNTMPFCFCVLIHCYCRVAVDRHRHHAPKTCLIVYYSPLLFTTRKSRLSAFFERILLYTLVMVSNSFFILITINIIVSVINLYSRSKLSNWFKILYSSGWNLNAFYAYLF